MLVIERSLKLRKLRICAMETEASGVDIWSETDTSVVDTNQKDLEHGGNMADILRGLQASLTRLATASEKQTIASEQQAAAITSLRDDIILNTFDPAVEDDEQLGSAVDASLNIDNTVANVLATTCVAVNDTEMSQDSVAPDSGP